MRARALVVAAVAAGLVFSQAVPGNAKPRRTASTSVTPASPSCTGDACPIQPGAYLETPRGACTMNFVFRDGSGKLYIGTAGHCFDRAGQEARAETRPGALVSGFGDTFVFGKAVHVEYEESGFLDPDSKDFALIEIAPEHHGKVNPAVRGWGGPTGVTTSSETRSGDVLLSSGHGFGVGTLEPTRERPRVLVEDTPTYYTSDSPSMFGDSGSPVLHARTGKALGLDSRFNVGETLVPTTDVGPTFEGITKRLNLQVVTAPY